jgi:transcriptional regulator of NAD metabolism
VYILQQKTESGYNFTLVVNKREIGIVASIEEEVFQTEKGSLLLKENVKEPVAVNTGSNKNMNALETREKKRIIRGGHVFQDNEVYEPIRIPFEGVKRKVIVFTPAALDFIGPGDQNQTISITRRC